MKPTDELVKHFRTTENQKKALKKLGILTIHDLLYHFPSRYITIADMKFVKDLQKGDHTLLYGTINKLKTSKAYRKKIPMAEGTFRDDTGTIKIVWFNQPYIAKMLKNDTSIRMEGKVAERNGKLYITNPEYEVLPTLPKNIGDSLFGKTKDSFSIPIYSERRGITSKWFYHTIQKVFASGMLEEIQDPVPEEILKKYNLPNFKTAIIWLHSPKKETHSKAARKRFAFEEVFFIQLQKQLEKKAYKEELSYIVKPDENNLKDFISRFPFEPTKAQTHAIDEIIKDVSSPTAMSRLLEGDVGSGKTAVAASTAHAVVTTRPQHKNGKKKGEQQDFGHLQVAYMVPTEILAKQHFVSFIEYFKHMPIQIGLITSSGCRKFPSKVDPKGYTEISRNQLLKWVKNGEIAVLIGTHSLIQKTVQFENLAYVIIDEQHRFGINQRKKLTKKNKEEGGRPLPHLLSMTATPIPRTLALTIYGDLDLTLLDEMPKGRKPIITEIVPPTRRKNIYEDIRERLKEGRQLYVICPRIDEPDPDKKSALQLKSVKEEARRLKKDIFPEYNIGILHGKMRPKEKDEAMLDFLNKKTEILCATSVVEVGVNVVNSTMIIIEGADRFGLSQLHQLRGRVVRSNHQAYCYVFTDSANKTTADRLRALSTASSGFELAEHDLMLRGPGQLVGTRQWGISDVAMEALKNLKMVEAARNEAKTLVEKGLGKKMEKYLENLERDIHFE